MTDYKVELITDVDLDLGLWLWDVAEHLTEINDHFVDGHQFDFRAYMKENYFWLCRRDGEPVGFLAAQLVGSIFDHGVRILMQDILYVSKGGGRAAHILMREFIDFGKLHADHIFTQTAKTTNIKGRSLEKLGFHKTEELYMMRVGNGKEKRN